MGKFSFFCCSEVKFRCRGFFYLFKNLFMLETLKSIDIFITLIINNLHSPIFDVIMFYISKTFIWIPFYLGILFFILRKEKKKIWFSIIFLALLIFLTDKISVLAFKDVFQRLRPCHNPDLQNLIHTVDQHCGGKYGFVSSHATNVFGTAMFTLLFFQKKWFTFVILIWATLVSYSRIYLGVHFFGDVFCGAILGMIIGFLTFFIYKRLYSHIFL